MFVERFLEPTRDVSGFLTPEAAISMDILLEAQGERGTRGNMLEIGVWHGKSAALAAPYVRDGETFYMIDAIAERLRPNVAQTFSSVGQDLSDERFQFTQCYSQDLEYHIEPPQGESRIRYMHIDGLHDASTVYADIAIADRICSNDSVIVLDDFFSPAFPAVTEAFYRYTTLNPHCMTLIMAGGKKGFVTRPRYAATYRTALVRNLNDRFEEAGLNMTLHKHSSDQDSFALGLEKRGRLTEPFHGDYKQELYDLI